MGNKGEMGGGLEGGGRQQTGQEFHWAPRGRKWGVQEGLPIGQEEHRKQSPRRERGRDKTACAAHVPQGVGQAHAQVTAQVTADALLGPPLCPAPGQQGKDMPWWAA